MLRILISFLLLFSYTFYGQTLIERLNAAKQNINSLLLSYDDGTFQFLNIADADSQFSNTFEILEDCFAFIASSRDSLDSDNERFINGIYKNNQLIWISDQIICEAADAFIFDIRDYNNNGNPEIIYTYSWGRGIMTDEDWWIYSWDGTSGNLISQTDENGYTMIKMLGSSARIIDLNSDGVLEILGSSDINSDSTLTFSWNGFLYGDWSNGLQAKDFYYTKANLFQAIVLSSTIKTTDDTIKYYYSVYNLPPSEQKIYKIYLTINVDSFYSISPSGWECIKWRNEPLVEFVEHNLPADITPEEFLSGKFKFQETEGISPGDSITGMWLVSKSLPIIVQYFLRSKSELVHPSDDLELFLQRSIHDIYENSVSGFTIGPSNVPLPFFPLEFLDSLINYNQRSSEIGWILNQTTADKYDGLFNTAKVQLQQNNNNAARTTLQTVLQEVDIDSTANLTSEAYALLRYNTEYLLEQIPQSSPNLLVNLTNSQGTQIPASNVKYYDSSWQDAIDNGDGTFTVITTKPTVSVRMFYEGANQTVNNVPAQNNTYTFQTVNAAVELQNSSGNLIDEGTVQYYAGSWRSFGTTVNGVANKELLPINYSFRMTYEYGSVDKQQDISVDPTVVFQTVNAAVELRNSTGALIDQGTVQYYAGAWRNFGTTVNGVTNKELLPKNYSFRMTYEYVSLDKQQDLTTNSTVTFSTVLCTVKVTNANNQPLESADTKYYSVAWKDIGLTNANGEITKELLPKDLNFRASLGGVTQDKQQDIGVNSLVEIQLNVP